LLETSNTCSVSLHWRQAVPVVYRQGSPTLTHWTDKQAGVARRLKARILSLTDPLVRDLDTSDIVPGFCGIDEVRLSFALKWATGFLQPVKSSVLRPSKAAVCCACTHQKTAQLRKSKGMQTVSDYQT